jgi:hypothetical protein
MAMHQITILLTNALLFYKSKTKLKIPNNVLLSSCNSGNNGEFKFRTLMTPKQLH